MSDKKAKPFIWRLDEFDREGPLTVTPPRESQLKKFEDLLEMSPEEFGKVLHNDGDDHCPDVAAKNFGCQGLIERLMFLMACSHRTLAEQDRAGRNLRDEYDHMHDFVLTQSEIIYDLLSGRRNVEDMAEEDRRRILEGMREHLKEYRPQHLAWEEEDKTLTPNKTVH